MLFYSNCYWGTTSCWWRDHENLVVEFWFRKIFILNLSLILFCEVWGVFDNSSLVLNRTLLKLSWRHYIFGWISIGRNLREIEFLKRSKFRRNLLFERIIESTQWFISWDIINLCFFKCELIGIQLLFILMDWLCWSVCIWCFSYETIIISLVFNLLWFKVKWAEYWLFRGWLFKNIRWCNLLWKSIKERSWNFSLSTSPRIFLDHKTNTVLDIEFLCLNSFIIKEWSHRMGNF